MLDYKTLAGLRKAVEKKYGRPLSEETWELLKPDWDPPFDGYDVTEVLKGLRDYKPDIQKKRNVTKALKRLSKESKRPFNPARANYSKFRYFRESVLGIKEPIPINKIKETLKQIGNSVEAGTTVCFIPIPREIYTIEVAKDVEVDVCEVDLFPIVDKWDKKTHFVDVVYSTSNMMNCHPALMVAFLLCDIPIKYNLLPAVIVSNPMLSDQGERHKITIEIPNPNVSKDMVSKVYTKVREKLIRDKREIFGKIPRPRSRTTRVVKIVEFLNKNPDIEWENIYQQWNTKYPKWAYKNIHSMQSAFYRAR